MSLLNRIDSPADLRKLSREELPKVADEIRALLGNSSFLEALPGHLPGDDASQARLPLIRERLRQLAAV